MNRSIDLDYELQFVPPRLLPQQHPTRYNLKTGLSLLSQRESQFHN
jgi:hypothetical protein